MGGQSTYDPDSPTIEILELTDKEIKFTLDNCDLSVANALRRIMIAEVPTMAVDKVLMTQNKSVLFDEFITHRLGLVPLRSEGVHQYKYVRECSCPSSCEQCSFTFQLDVKARDEPLAVTTKDLQSHTASTSHNDVRPVSPRDSELTDPNLYDTSVLLARLVPDQELKLQGFAQKGIGKLHAKWSPVTSVKLQHEPDILINHIKMAELTEEEKKGFVKSCPTGVYSFENQRVEIKDIMNCTFCNECFYYAEEEIKKKQLVTIQEKPNRFTITVETTGALPPERVVTDALQVLLNKLTEVRQASEIATRGH